MYYNVNLTISDEELSIIYTVLHDYVNKHTSSEFVGVEFEKELATKVKVILDVKRIKNKDTSNIDML